MHHRLLAFGHDAFIRHVEPNIRIDQVLVFLQHELDIGERQGTDFRNAPVKTSLTAMGPASLVKGYGDMVFSIRRTRSGQAQCFKKCSVGVTNARSVRPNFKALKIILKNNIGRAQGSGPFVFNRRTDEVEGHNFAIAATQRGRPVVSIVIDVALKVFVGFALGTSCKNLDVPEDRFIDRRTFQLEAPIFAKAARQ